MTDKITHEDFTKIDLRIGQIKKAEKHPNADKLLILTVDLGEEKDRIIVAGLAQHYKPKELENKKAVFVANLEPATLRGIESNGMILAGVSDNKEEINILSIEEKVPAGTKVS